MILKCHREQFELADEIAFRGDFINKKGFRILLHLLCRPSQEAMLDQRVSWLHRYSE